MMDAARPTPSFNRRDREAIRAYEAECTRSSAIPTEEDRLAWVHEWRALDEEHRLAGVEAQEGWGGNEWDRPDMLEPG